MKFSVYQRLFFILFFFSFTLLSHAQRDTGKGQTIQIVSAYKPVLRDAAKINFSASQLNVDTTAPKLTYSIPALNLFYSYQPISLRPLALQQDTNLYLGARNFIKAGLGNYTTPYLSAGFSFGEAGKKIFGIYADYISSKGKIEHQDYSLMSVKGNATYFVDKNEMNVSAGVTQNNYYLYGYDHDLYKYSKKEVQQQFGNVYLNADIQNITDNQLSIDYHPAIQANIFTNRDKLTETSLLIIAPFSKQLNDQPITMHLSAKADLSFYKTKNLVPSNISLSNNVVQVEPAVSYDANNYKLYAGVLPTWDSGTFALLPNVSGEVTVQEGAFAVQAGIIGKYVKNSFKNLTALNPYIQTLSSQINTREVEAYGGVKATFYKHFNISAKAGWVTFRNFALFVNDTATDGKSFNMAYESKANSLRIHGDMSYIDQDKFILTAGLTFNGYTGFDQNGKAWNTVPTEFTSSLRWWPSKNLLLKSDCYVFGGGNFIEKDKVAKSFSGGVDVSVGGEYKLNKMFSIWMDINNIFSNKYQRWHNYEVYGLNVLGGVRAVF